MARAHNDVEAARPQLENEFFSAESDDDDFKGRRHSWTANTTVNVNDGVQSATTIDIPSDRERDPRKNAAQMRSFAHAPAGVTGSPLSSLLGSPVYRFGSGGSNNATEAIQLSEYASGISIMSGLANIGMLGSSNNSNSGKNSPSNGTSGSGVTSRRSVNFNWGDAWPARFEGSGFTTGAPSLASTGVDRSGVGVRGVPTRRVQWSGVARSAVRVASHLMLRGQTEKERRAYCEELHLQNIKSLRLALLFAAILPVFYGLVTSHGGSFPHLYARPFPLAAVEMLFAIHLLLTFGSWYARVMQSALCSTIVLYTVLALAPYSPGGTATGALGIAVPTRCNPSPDFVLKWLCVALSCSVVGLRFAPSVAATWISFGIVEIYVHASMPCLPYEDPMVLACLAAMLLAYAIDRARFADFERCRDIARKQDMLVDSSTNQMKSSRAKTEFLSVVSHELRTPLTSIFGFADLLLESDLSTEQKEYVDMMVEAGQHLLGHINNMLNFSKFASYGDSAGRPELVHPVAFDLGLHLEEIGELFAPKAAEKGLELVVHISSEIRPRVVGDMALLRNVIMNLIDNGIKFTRKGEVVLRAHVVKTVPESQDIVFTISDSGIGIPPHVTAGGFVPFQQADSSHNREFEGAGLGLCICETLLRAMHSSLDIRGVENVGTTASFVLRLGVDDTLFERMPLNHVTEESVGRIADLQVAIIANTKVALALRETLLPWRCTVSIAASPIDPFDGLYGMAPGAQNSIQSSLMNSGAGVSAHQRAVTFDQTDADADGAASGKVILEPGALVDTMLIVDYASIPGSPEDYMRGLAARMRRLHIADCTMVVVLLPMLERGTLQADLRRLGIRRFLIKPVKSKDVRDLLLAAVADTVVSAPSLEVAHSGAPFIILAERDSSNRVLMSKWLQKLRIAHEAVSNGQEVINIVRRRRPLLILMDLQLPVKDGFQTTLEIREFECREGQPCIPIVALTARITLEQMLAAGMNDYLEKPVRMRELVTKVQFWISHGAKSVGTSLSVAGRRMPPPASLGSGGILDVAASVGRDHLQSQQAADTGIRGFLGDLGRKLSSGSDGWRMSLGSDNVRKISATSEGRKAPVGNDATSARKISTSSDGRSRGDGSRMVSSGSMKSTPGVSVTARVPGQIPTAGRDESDMRHCDYCLDLFVPHTNGQIVCPECARLDNLELKLDEIADEAGARVYI